MVFVFALSSFASAKLQAPDIASYDAAQIEEELQVHQTLFI
jgi:hypothetical protein